MINDTLTKWASNELLPWRGREIADLSSIVESSPSIFLLRIDRNGATLDPKLTNAVLIDRARHYERFICSIARTRQLPALDLAIDVKDLAAADSNIPVFSFQKEAESSILLLPDIDFLASNFYSNPDLGFPDQLPFSSKLTSAIFVGSTTAGYAITHENIDAGSVPRLRLAEFARPYSSIVVRLPNIAQCLDQTVEERLRLLGHGGARIAWRDQSLHRYLISMDGNGATCSRVYLSLLSNSVLVKYKSSQVLHYFAGLQDEENFIEVSNDHELLTVLERSEEDGFAIAKAGREFAEDFLCRSALERYTEILLRSFSALQ